METPTAQASPRKGSGVAGAGLESACHCNKTYLQCKTYLGSSRLEIGLANLANLARKLTSEGQLGDRRQLHEGCALVDFADLGVAVELLDGVVLDEAGAAVDLDGQAGDALGYLRGEVFAHGGLLEEVELRVLEPGGVVDEEAGGFDVGGHLGELELHGLELDDGLAELLAFFGPLCGVAPCALGEAEHLGADADAAFVEGLDGDLVAFAGFAEDLRGRDDAVAEDELAGAGGADAELVFFFAESEAGGVFFDEEGGDAFVAGGGVEGGEDDEDAGLFGVGDPELLAVEDVVVATLRLRASAVRRRRSRMRLR